MDDTFNENKEYNILNENNDIYVSVELNFSPALHYVKPKNVPHYNDDITLLDSKKHLFVIQDKEKEEEIINILFMETINKYNNENNNLTYLQKSNLDALYKQITIGDCFIKKFPLYNPYKYLDWLNWLYIKGMSKEDAMYNYISTYNIYTTLF